MNGLGSLRALLIGELTMQCEASIVSGGMHDRRCIGCCQSQYRLELYVIVGEVWWTGVALVEMRSNSPRMDLIRSEVELLTGAPARPGLA